MDIQINPAPIVMGQESFAQNMAMTMVRALNIEICKWGTESAVPVLGQPVGGTMMY